MKVEIPSEYVELCMNWHSGQYSMFYAISSCGYLGTGTERPEDCESEEDWMLSLLNSLECEIYDCLKYATKETTISEDSILLNEFLKFVSLEQLVLS